MTTATEIIAFLLPRRQMPVVEKEMGLPESWASWLRERRQRLGPITSQPIRAVLEVWGGQRDIRFVKRSPMSRWRALRSLLWQGWDPPPKEERGTRWAGVIGSLLLHLGFVALLLMISLIMLLPAREDTETTRTQLTLIGRGTQNQGGGASPQSLEKDAQASATSQPKARMSHAKRAAQRSAPAPSAAKPSSVAASASTSAVPPAQPAPPTPPTAAQPQSATQPLQVTETAQPTQDFVLPPVTPPQLQVEVPQVTPRIREIEPVQSVAPVPVQQITVQPVQVQTPAPSIQVHQREIPTPADVVSVQAPTLQALRPDEHQVQVQLQPAQPAPVRVREIPMPKEAEAPASDAAHTQPTAAEASVTEEPQAPESKNGNASSTEAAPTAQGSSSAQTTSNAPENSAPPSSVSVGQSAGNLPPAAGAGNEPRQEYGTPGPKTADDWGAAPKAGQGTEAGVDKGVSGLFNPDGSVKLPSDLTGGRTVKPGVPGSRQQARIDADRAGKWLNRPAFGADSSASLDKSWIPGGTLLQDWVRAGIKKIDIPIPGTTTHIRCVVSILQAGGACGLFDDNLKDHPAAARPPPEIPIKRNPIPEGS